MLFEPCVSLALDDALPLLGEHPIDKGFHVRVLIIGAVYGVNLIHNGIRTVFDVLAVGINAVKRKHLHVAVLNDALHVKAERKSDGAAEKGIVILFDRRIAHEIHKRGLASASRVSRQNTDALMFSAKLAPIRIFPCINTANLITGERIHGILFIDKKNEKCYIPFKNTGR